MNFLPGRHALETIVQPETFDAGVAVNGLPTDVLEALFYGSANARDYWKTGLSLTADLAASTNRPQTTPSKAEVAPSADPSEQDLPDGCARLQSGAPGVLNVERRHSMADLLIPQSLYLLLAQQWARAGLLLVHGAAFEYNGTGILAMGETGAGKSVLTAAALAARARVVSDDWVMVGRDNRGRLNAERLREFMMLRHGRACDQLLAQLPNLAVRSSPNWPKSVIAIPDAQSHGRHEFPRHCRIDEAWILQPPAAERGNLSESAPAPPGTVLSALIQATMPLFFSKRFPVELRLVRKASQDIIRKCDCRLIKTGTHLIDQPGAALRALA